MFKSVGALGETGVVIDPDVVDLMPRYVSSRRGLLGDLRKAILNDEKAVVRSISHKLKGSFGLYGFLDLANICSKIEDGHPVLMKEELLVLVGDLELALERIENAAARQLGAPISRR